MTMKSGLENSKPTKRFIMYFEEAKRIYMKIHECDKVTQKAMVTWYNEAFHSSLTEASLSKYLKGKNEIPIEVYVNMKELARIDDVFCGVSASREEYNIASSLKESLEFIEDEVEYICQNNEFRLVCGEQIQQILKGFMEYCHYSVAREYELSMKKLQELQSIIHDAENKMAEEKYDCIYNSGHIKKAIGIATEANYVKSGFSTIRLQYIYDDLLNRIRRISMEMKKCNYLQNKIDESHYCDIPALEERSVLEKVELFIENVTS